MKLSVIPTNLGVVLAVATLLTAVSLTVYAQEETETVASSTSTSTATSTEEVGTSTEPQRPVSVEERVERLEDARFERQAERRGVLQDRAQTRIINLAANTSNRLEAAIRRLDNVADRMESRIGKMEATGLEMSASKQALATARIELDRARTRLANIDVDVVTFVSSADPQTNWGRVKNIYTDSRDAIKAAHTALVLTLTAMQQAPTTPTPTPEAEEATDSESLTE